VLGRILTCLISLVAIFMARSESPSAREIPSFSPTASWIQVSGPAIGATAPFPVDSGAAVSVVNLGTAQRLA